LSDCSTLSQVGQPRASLLTELVVSTRQCELQLQRGVHVSPLRHCTSVQLARARSRRSSDDAQVSRNDIMTSSMCSPYQCAAERGTRSEHGPRGARNRGKVSVVPTRVTRQTTRSKCAHGSSSLGWLILLRSHRAVSHRGGRQTRHVSSLRQWRSQRPCTQH
jgi:hypothetical protein